MAGKLLNSLKAGDSKAATSHEARLGIMVITILVFAFGFLVYHKMDMQQSRLTQAAIGPNAVAPTETSPINPVAEFVSQQPRAAATDPLVNIADLSDESPFSNSEVMLDEPIGSAVSQIEEFDSVNRIVLSEPADGPEVPELASSDSALIALPKVAAAAIPEFTLSEPSEPEAPELVAISEPGENPSPVFPEPLPTFADVEVESVVVQEEILAMSPEISMEPAAEVPEFPEPEQVEEPVLLALAEPQTSESLAEEFLTDELPLELSPEPEVAPAFPSFESTPVERISESPKKQHVESRGFNAIKKPSEKKQGHSIRTAAGSGSDGKFSLAAFNYQNGATQSAPDDGSTFDSVVVQNGDNYTKISQRVYGTVKYFAALAVFNQHRIAEPRSMRPGMVVLVPDKAILEERYPELFVDSKPKTPEIGEFLILDDGSPAYRVGERETISEISGRFLGRSSRWIEIYRLNQSVLNDPDKLKAGVILALPADAAEVNVLP